jgi:2-polyprenyl-3-methyl-5-hydroxy-6-metoxy-1,4-benzoquinol methylase
MSEAQERRDALAERLFGAVLGFFDIHAVELGVRLGLYRALRDAGSATSADLADATGTSERSVREWLEQQATGGILAVDDTDLAPAERRFSIPPGHDEVLLDPDSLAYLAPLARLAVAAARPLPQLREAFRSGGGIPYADFGADFHEAQGAGNRALYLRVLGAEWLPAIPEVHERLLAGPPARIADVACGAAWSSIAIARAYPQVTVDALDLDESSIALARGNVEAAGLADRVRCQVRDAADPALAHRYDLVTVFEAVHDMSRPVEVLGALRGLLADGGSLLVADERVAETFTAPGTDVERFMYGWSILHCLPVGMAEQPSAGTGTVMRPATLEAYARDAGFGGFDVLPIEHDTFRLYLLRP